MKVNIFYRQNKDDKTPYFRWWDREEKKYHHKFLDFRISGKSKDREYDKQRKKQIEKLRFEFETELSSRKLGIPNPIKRNTPFIEYFIDVKERKKKSRGWDNVLFHLKQFELKNTPLFQINVDWVEKLKEFLVSREGVSPNTSNHYYQNIKCCLNTSVKEGILLSNPTNRVEGIKVIPNKPESLTWEEVELISKTPTKFVETKRGFLFSCYSGMRYSDIKKLTFGEIDFKKNEIRFNQKKTSDFTIVPLHPTGRELVLQNIPKGTTPLPSMLVFPELGNPQKVNYELKKMCLQIKKRLHFHLGRSTFGSNCYENTEDIYVVSQLLGHKQVSTTQKYLKISPKKLSTVVNTLPKLEIV